jgi:enoyl-CoA hydratase/carnithine racemase
MAAMTEGAATTVPPMSVLRISVEGPIGRITLARPQKLNALNRAALEELAAAAEWFDAEASIKVVIVSGEGRAFSAGFDLADDSWRDAGPPKHSAIVGRRMATAIGDMQAVTIAAIRGHCIGGGVVLASACDLRIASENAMFRIPEVDLGIPLFWTGVPRLTREVGPALAKELIMTGRSMDAREARTARFVNHVVSDDDLTLAAEELARALAAKPALVLRTTKRQIDEAVPSIVAGDGGAGADAEGFAAALADEECRAAAKGYRNTRR